MIKHDDQNKQKLKISQDQVPEYQTTSLPVKKSASILQKVILSKGFLIICGLIFINIFWSFAIFSKQDDVAVLTTNQENLQEINDFGLAQEQKKQSLEKNQIISQEKVYEENRKEEDEIQNLKVETQTIKDEKLLKEIQRRSAVVEAYLKRAKREKMLLQAIERKKYMKNHPQKKVNKKNQLINTQLKEKSHLQLEKKIYEMKFPMSLWEDESLQAKSAYAVGLKNIPSYKNFQSIEYYRLNSLYNISEFKEQLPLCVSVVGKSTQKTFKNMLKTVFQQKYNNYKVVFVDDSANDKVIKIEKQYISNFDTLNIIQIYNEEPQFSLKNRYISIKDHCDEDDIVIDVDLDDSLIGLYVFQLINTLYQRYPDKWALYLNCITDSKEKVEMPSSNEGFIPEQIFEENSYRTSDLWKTGHLRTFKRKLFMKIDENDFLDSNGNFYHWKADGFVHFSLIQLAGRKHSMKIDEPVYYYKKDVPRSRNPEKKICSIAAHMLTPYLPLQNLEDVPQRMTNYKIPQKLLKKILKMIENYEQDINIKNFPAELLALNLHREDKSTEMKFEEDFEESEEVYEKETIEENEGITYVI